MKSLLLYLPIPSNDAFDMHSGRLFSLILQPHTFYHTPLTMFNYLFSSVERPWSRWGTRLDRKECCSLWYSLETRYKAPASRRAISALKKDLRETTGTIVHSVHAVPCQSYLVRVRSRQDHAMVMILSLHLVGSHH